MDRWIQFVWLLYVKSESVEYQERLFECQKEKKNESLYLLYRLEDH